MLCRYFYRMVVDTAKDFRELIPALLELVWELLEATIVMVAQTFAFGLRIVWRREWIYLKLFTLQTAFLIATITIYGRDMGIISDLGGAMYLIGLCAFACLAAYVGGEMDEDCLVSPAFLSLFITGGVLVAWNILK